MLYQKQRFLPPYADGSRPSEHHGGCAALSLTVWMVTKLQYNRTFYYDPKNPTELKRLELEELSLSFKSNWASWAPWAPVPGTTLGKPKQVNQQSLFISHGQRTGTEHNRT